jgi:hypothetical protein
MHRGQAEQVRIGVAVVQGRSNTAWIIGPESSGIPRALAK